MTTKRVLIYARLSVSTDESVSIARQLEACRKYAEARGWEVAGEFVDDGVSATANRPEDRGGWKALVAAAADGCDAVVVWKVDRLARRVLDFLHAHEALSAAGAGLVAVEDPIDMTTPQGRAFAVMLSVFAEMEAETIRARVSAARAHIVREGRWAGGSAPYGWRAVPNPAGPGVVLAKDPDRVEWVQGAAARVLRGDTLYSVKKWLDSAGVPTPLWRPPLAWREWNYHSLWRLLRNPVLAGMTPRNPGRGRHDPADDPFSVVRDAAGLPVVDEAIAVVSTEEFRSLVARIDDPGSPQARRRSDKETTSPLLSRVVRCDDCSVFMTRGTNQKRPVLNCPKCHMTLTRTTFEPYLIRRLLDERGDHLLIEAARPAPTGGARLSDVEEALRRTTSEMLQDGADIDALSARVKALREERSRLSREPVAEPEWVFTGQTVREAWDASGDDLERRDVLLSQVESLRIRRGVVGRYFDEARVLLEWRDTSFTVM